MIFPALDKQRLRKSMILRVSDRTLFPPPDPMHEFPCVPLEVSRINFK
jgi:hypothetical protein